MSESLKGTVALVTGASSGIGEATALELAGRGARVAIVARRRDRLDEVAKRLDADGGEVAVVEADVTDEAAARGRGRADGRSGSAGWTPWSRTPA